VTARDLSSLYKTIADEATMAILAFTPDGYCSYANKLAHDLFEFPMLFDLSKFKIENLYVTDAHENRIRTFTKDTLEVRGVIQEILMRKQNDAKFIASLSVKAIDLSHQKGHLLMVHDITLQKKLQREVTAKQLAIHQAYQDLLGQNKQLKELDVAKNRFVAVTTHELRTPLSAMVASAEILKLKLYDSQGQHDEFLAMIYDQGQHMLNLVNDILDFAKIQSNKMDYYIEEQSLCPVVANEVAALQSMAAASEITLTSVQCPTESQCYFDEVRIRQVLANLINNAIKYNSLKGSVQVYLESTETHVKVFVKDSGKGIAAEDQEKVFNEFETLGKVAHHAKGTGLGLPISRRMMTSMGGDVKLSSREGEGSTFWIEVPKTRVLEAKHYRKRPDGSGDLAA
jgi:signal transduction histidine kinase